MAPRDRVRMIDGLRNITAYTTRDVLIVRPILRWGTKSFGASHRVDIRDLDRQIDNVAHSCLGHAPNVEGLTDCRAAIGIQMSFHCSSGSEGSPNCLSSQAITRMYQIVL